ncbi:MAG TPA: BTAD domain-containing putative transcriptional regulator [Segeticoccus sp.]|nr:BTAD domain-containing putative transcriptional regulator [Segeticoccus sp.]
MQVRILGEIEICDGERVVPVAGARLRRLLLALAVDVGRFVPTRELVDGVWGDDAPADASGALQTLVSRLRRTLGVAGLVQQGPGGYRLSVPADQVDGARFASLARQGHGELTAGSVASAAETLTTALALWDGSVAPEVLEGDATTWSVPARFARWEELRLDALADRAEAVLRGGATFDVVGELEELAAAHPLRERFTVLLMRALVAGGRPAEALSAYERTRGHLAEQLGADPSPALQDEHLSVLRGQRPAAGDVARPEPGPTGPDTAARRRRRTNLPNGVTSFIGRDDDVKRVDGLLRDGRLVTVVGPGGAGKTRLSVETGGEWVDRLRDGVWFVPLAPVTDEADIGATILGSLGIRENDLLERRADRLARDAMERLLDSLAESDALVVLDNCEHLVDGVARVVDRLLAESPNVRILATSREPLAVDGEALWSLSSLGLPAADADAGEALDAPSVQLFAERGVAALPDFRVDAATVGPVVEIVRRLDGLPLALELAAARLRVLPVEEVAARLSDRFTLLTGGRRTALPRHRTLRAVVQWSWDLLDDAERLLAERLAVFPAGASASAVAAVCADGRLPESSLPDLLASLVDKSLLQVVPGGRAGLRYRMLETIREYGIDRLVERGEIDAARRAHADHFRAMAHEADARLRTRGQLPWLAWFGEERDNVLAALRHLGETGEVEAATDLALDLVWYWSLVGSHGEAATWLRYVGSLPGVARSKRAPVLETVQLLTSIAEQEREPMRPESPEQDGGPDGDDPAGEHIVLDAGLGAEPSEEQLVARWRALGERLDRLDVSREPLLLVLRPVLSFLAGDQEQAERYIEQALAVDDPWIRSAVGMFRANVAENAGELDVMREQLDTSLRGFTAIGERWGLSSVLGARAHVRTLDGDLPGALEDYERASAFLAELGAPRDSDMLRMRKLTVLVRMGELDRARREAQEIRAEAEDGSTADRLVAEMTLAGIAQAAGDTEEVRRLRERLPDLLRQHRRWNPLMGHAHAILFAMVAASEVEDGLVGEATEHLRLAHDAAVRTRDMPVVSNVAVAAAELALAHGDADGAAQLLGVAATLRGSDDLTDVVMGRVRGRLREVLADGFEPAYRRGRGLGRDEALARLAAAIPSPD